MCPSKRTDGSRTHLSLCGRLIEPVLEPDGIELVEIEFKPERGRWVLRLYIDTPRGVTLDDCELVSRQVGALLDMKDPIRATLHPGGVVSGDQ